LRIRTAQVYVDWIKRFIRYLGKADHSLTILLRSSLVVWR
jgi:mevalonate pyrophosphate decarboxylase